MVVLCFSLMLVSAVYLGSAFGTSPLALALGQLVFILGPPVLLAAALTSDPIGTLRLRGARLSDLALGAGLAVAMNPLVAELRPLVQRLFPVPVAVEEALKGMMGKIPNIPTALLLLAVVPAICEEVAFRGFILSGLRSRYRAWSAIVLSALLFGLLHVLLSLFQQLFNATLLGLVLGLLAIRTRSLWPGVLFHATNNGLAVLMAALAGSPRFAGVGRALYRNAAESQYHYAWIAAGAVGSAAGIASLLTRRPEGEAPGGGG
jgi:sodium transport system permease protein